MAEGAMAITVKTNLSRDNGQRRRLAFRAIHGVPQMQKTSEKAKLQPQGKLTLIFYVEDIQRLLCKMKRHSPKSAILEKLDLIISNIF
jgi:hypothetical protein